MPKGRGNDLRPHSIPLSGVTGIEPVTPDPPPAESLPSLSFRRAFTRPPPGAPLISQAAPENQTAPCRIVFSLRF